MDANISVLAAHKHWHFSDQILFDFSKEMFFRKMTPDKGIFIFDGRVLTLRWDKWPVENLVTDDAEKFTNANKTFTLLSKKAFRLTINNPLKSPTLKRLILVGNSSQILGMNLGNLIDNYDHIIRFNGFRIDFPYYTSVGKKTDEFFTTDRFAQRIPKYKIKYNKIYNPSQVVFPKEYNRFCLDHRIHLQIMEHVYENNNKRPSTGFMAIYYFLFVQKHEYITITNFDFQLDHTKPVEYFKPEAEADHERHDFVFEKKYVTRLVKEGRIVILEDVLKY